MGWVGLVDGYLMSMGATESKVLAEGVLATAWVGARLEWDLH